MAENPTLKALNMARECVAAVEALMAAFEKLEALEAERASAGLDLTAYDAEYLGHGDLQHVTGAILNSTLNTSVPAILAWMRTNFHDDNLNKVRP